MLRVSYSGYYVAFPRLRSGFNSQYPHHAHTLYTFRRAHSTKPPERHTIPTSMPIPKTYLHDKLVLLLVSVNIFLTFLCVLLILLRLGAGHGSDSYIVQFRANLGISAFKTGSITNILSFMLFCGLAATTNILLSIKVYRLRRELSIILLGLGILLLVLAIIVSNALLVLR